MRSEASPTTVELLFRALHHNPVYVPCRPVRSQAHSVSDIHCTGVLPKQQDLMLVSALCVAQLRGPGR
jgi:hypothetical protein